MEGIERYAVDESIRCELEAKLAAAVLKFRIVLDMDNRTRYHRETQAAIFQGKTVTVTHLTPILSPEQRDKRKREVEHQLYEVFSKYRKRAKTDGSVK